MLLISFSFSFESDVAAISGEATDRIAVVRVGEQKKWPTYLQFYLKTHAALNANGAKQYIEAEKASRYRYISVGNINLALLHFLECGHQ